MFRHSSWNFYSPVIVRAMIRGRSRTAWPRCLRRFRKATCARMRAIGRRCSCSKMASTPSPTRFTSDTRRRKSDRGLVWRITIPPGNNHRGHQERLMSFGPPLFPYSACPGRFAEDDVRRAQTCPERDGRQRSRIQILGAVVSTCSHCSGFARPYATTDPTQQGGGDGRDAGSHATAESIHASSSRFGTNPLRCPTGLPPLKIRKFGTERMPNCEAN